MKQEKPKLNFSALLQEALEKPGRLAECYTWFRDYSIGNSLWALGQMYAREIKPGPIATFKKWQALGRQVQKGEKALHLMMPIVKEDKETGDKSMFFVTKSYWFSYSQTTGPEIDLTKLLTGKFDQEKMLETLGIEQVPFDSVSGNTMGYAQDNKIAINPVNPLPHKTLFHETAHCLLHTGKNNETLDRSTKEVEAEGVTYIILCALDLPGKEESRGYLQHWLAGNKLEEKTARRIFGAADKILKAGLE